MLPPNVHFKHGAYYLVKGGKWTRIPSPDAPAAIVHALKVRFAYCRMSASNRKLAFDLTEAEVMRLADKAGWKCAVTGAPFSLDRVGKSGKRPLGPSIDRIDCARGYEKGNVRVVCLAANMAMSDWGEAALLYLLMHGNSRRLKDTPEKTALSS